MLSQDRDPRFLMNIFNHPAALFFCRFASIIAMSVWLGGFMFYGGLVIPILDDAFGQLDAGMLVTRHATSRLNIVGFGTLLVWSVLIGLEARIHPLWARNARIFFLMMTAMGLGILVILHMRMSRHLDSQGVRDFKPFHRLYLIISTLQWVANMAIVALTIWLWTGWKKPDVSIN
jgi:hypothetical protein